MNIRNLIKSPLAFINGLWVPKTGILRSNKGAIILIAGAPLMANKPKNCIIWGEREDVDNFYGSMDLLLFTSKKELSPIVVREALGWQMPILMRNLPSYMEAYDSYPQITFIDENVNKTIERITMLLTGDSQKNQMVRRLLDIYNLQTSKRENDTTDLIYDEIYVRREYEAGGCFVEKGDVVVDLGAEVCLSFPKGSLGMKQTYKEINEDKIYDIAECQVKQGDVVVDIGANVGMFSLFAAKKGASKIFAFEPNKQNYDCLVKNISIELCKTFNLGVVDKKGEFDLFIDEYSGGHSLFQNKTQTGEIEKVKCVSLRSLFDDKIVSKIDFLKVDAEGAEKKIFEGLPDRYFKKIKKIALEWHHNVFMLDNSLDLLLGRLSKWYRYKEVQNGYLSMVYFWKEDDQRVRLLLEEKKDRVLINYNFVQGPYCEIIGQLQSPVLMKFFDQKDGREYYSTRFEPDGLPLTHWAKGNRKWFTDWKIVVESMGKKIFEQNLNLRGRRVMISLGSKSLGDTIAWFPYLEEFRKKHDCHVIASTFWNKLFEEKYLQIEFVEPGTVVRNLFAQYEIGYRWEFDKDLNPIDCRTVPLQKVATDILGLEFKEIKPEINFNPEPIIMRGNYVTVSEHSTARCKYWEYPDGLQPDGWQEVVDHLSAKGLQVVAVSSEPTRLSNVIDRTGGSIEQTMSLIKNSLFYIGLGSGPTWLAWALDVPTIMISGWSARWCEFQETERNIRIINENVCHGCMNSTEHVFDKANWNWCPQKKNFECTRKITPEMVIGAVEQLLEGNV